MVIRDVVNLTSRQKYCVKKLPSVRFIIENFPIFCYLFFFSGKLEEQPNIHPAQEKDPLPEFPDGVNPKTGEIGGPKGPEPTRYGDWERKGRVTDF